MSSGPTSSRDSRRPQYGIQEVKGPVTGLERGRDQGGRGVTRTPDVCRGLKEGFLTTIRVREEEGYHDITKNTTKLVFVLKFR